MKTNDKRVVFIEARIEYPLIMPRGVKIEDISTMRDEGLGCFWRGRYLIEELQAFSDLGWDPFMDNASYRYVRDATKLDITKWGLAEQLEALR